MSSSGGGGLGHVSRDFQGPEEARRLALKAAEDAAALLREREDLTKDMAISAFVNDIFSATYDLLHRPAWTRERPRERSRRPWAAPQKLANLLKR